MDPLTWMCTGPGRRTCEATLASMVAETASRDGEAPWVRAGLPTPDRPWPWDAFWRAPKVLWGRTFPLSLDGPAQIVELVLGSRHTRRLTARRATGRRGREGGRPHPRYGDEHE